MTDQAERELRESELVLRVLMLALGFDAHLAKPTSPAGLVLIVAKLVGRAT